jgi:4-alpha-glucanotransferase
MINKRASGILMHISSLPGDYSVGSLGNRAYRFVDFLADSGFSYWQVLPLCMADDCASPYKSPGYYSANPYFIDLEILYEEGLVTLDEVNSTRQNNPYVAEYERLERERLEILFRAAQRCSCKCKVDSFIDTHPGVKSLALYLALRDKNGRAPFRD